MRSARDILLPTAALAMAIGLGGCAVRPPRIYRLEPAPGPNYSVESGSVSIVSEKFRLTIIPLDDLARAAFIRARAAGAADPFSPGPGGIDQYMTFRLTIENVGAKEPVSFQPQAIYIATESNDRLYPYDFPEAYSHLFGRSNNDPRLLDDMSKYLFDVGVSVPPGKRAEGLLIYPMDRASRARKLRMEFTFLAAPGEATDNYDIFFTREIRD